MTTCASIAEDPNKKGLLFAGTGNGFYYSMDDGGHWTAMQAGLPPAPVTWIVVQKNFHDVIVSTYGRGLYILHDITPLEQMADKAAAANARLFVPRLTYRFTRGGRAYINYELKTAPKDGVKIEILDAAGTVIRDVRGPARAGLNRASWDLRVEPPRLVALRTTPPENPHIWEEPRFRGQETRPVTHWGLAPAQVGPIVAAGKYAVRLTVDGQAQSEPIEIAKDPKVTATDADLEASVNLQLRIRDDISASADIVNQLEVLRRQLEEAQKGMRGQKGKEELLKSVAAMDKRMLEVENMILEPAAMLSDDKYFVAGLSRLHEPDLAQRRGGAGRRRRRGRRGLPPHRHVGRRSSDY